LVELGGASLRTSGDDDTTKRRARRTCRSGYKTILARFQIDFLDGKAEAQVSVTTAESAIEHQRITLLSDEVQDVVIDRRAGTLTARATVDRDEIGWRLRRAQLWIADGLPEKARVELESIRELDPSNPEIFLALAEMEEKEGN
jgi:hypothetical protein